LAACLLTSCVSTYNSRARAAHRAYHRGDYERALKIIEKAEPAPRDRLLYLMDKGMILHGAGQYERSNKVLTKAEELSDALTAKSISREVSATLWSEEAVNYAGDKYERVMIPVIRMLNYIMLDQWDEARVEVRRIEHVVERAYGAGEKPNNAFATYMSAVVWEAMGDINDALIDYRRTGKIDPELPYYGRDLKYAGRRLSMPVDLPKEGAAAWSGSKGYRKSAGELVVITESGRAPRFVSEAVTAGMYSVQMPTVVAWPLSVKDATVYVDGEEVGATHTFYNVGDDILRALRDRRKRSFVRKAIKMAVQTGLYAASLELMDTDKVETQIAGIALMFLGMSMAASEKADERSWRTLPAAFGVGRFYMEPGRRTVRVVPEGGGAPIELDVELRKDRPTAVLAHLTGQRGRAKRLAAKEPAGVREARRRQQALEHRLESEPSNGSLKIELAYARMEAGEYGVSRLLIEGMEGGGSKSKGMMGLVIANTVEGDYRAAASWARKGAALGGSHRNKLEDYKRVASALSSGSAAVPPSAGRPLRERDGIENAFDWFVSGLTEERSSDYEDATRKFVKAYELGLVGALVEKRVMESFKRTPESFKESEAGAKIMEEFAESLLE